MKSTEPQMTVITPESGKELLLNPGKGWVAYPEMNPPEDMKYAGIGYTRFEWAQIEPIAIVKRS